VSVAEKEHEEATKAALDYLLRQVKVRYDAVSTTSLWFDEVAKRVGNRDAQRIFHAAAGSSEDLRELKRDMAACNVLVALIVGRLCGKTVDDVAGGLTEGDELRVFAPRGGKTNPSAIKEQLRSLLRGEEPKKASPLLKRLMRMAAEAHRMAPNKPAGRPPKQKK
jgi:hypothetical protein